jgi:Fe-S-cluster containining protein
MRGSEAWYRDGLRFECGRCGHCCRGAGNVWVTDADVARLAEVLEVSDAELRARYTRRRSRGVSLRQKRNQDCVFWDAETGCQVYAQRPRQCRSYPFWAAVVRTSESWQAEAERCPGVGRGPLHSATAIDASAADDGIPRARTRLKTGDG